jgi:nucleotide-binding universal stress UspA family protein
MTTQLDRAEYGPGDRRSEYERGTDGPRVVLVGVDGSRTSLRAAAYAAGLARRQRSRLVVVYVAAPSALNVMADSLIAQAIREGQDELADDLRRECQRGAEELAVPVTFLCRHGDPYAELRSAADELKADLVVVGSSERTGHRLVGSIANRLVRCGRWPVIVVP